MCGARLAKINYCGDTAPACLHFARKTLVASQIDGSSALPGLVGCKAVAVNQVAFVLPVSVLSFQTQ